MNIIGKLIAILALVFMILILVNVRSVLPYISMVMFGGSATSSVTAVTDDLIKQVESIYPADSLTAYASGDKNAVMVYTTIRSLTTSRSYNYNSGQDSKGLITFKHSGNSLSMVTENITIPQESQGKYHFWLTNERDISTSTRRLDFGTVRYSGRQMYMYNLSKINASTSTAPFSFKEFRYLKIINPADLTIFAESVIQ